MLQLALTLHEVDQLTLHVCYSAAGVRKIDVSFCQRIVNLIEDNAFCRRDVLRDCRAQEGHSLPLADEVVRCHHLRKDQLDLRCEACALANIQTSLMDVVLFAQQDERFFCKLL